VLFLFVALFGLIVSAIAFSPRVLIKNIQSGTEISIASRLLFILAFFSPLIIFQRVLDIIYGVRLEQFVIQRMMTGASILKMVSVFYFFQGTRYDIVGYFLFCQIVNGTALLFCAIIAKIRYQYSFFMFVKAFRFSRLIFNKTKALASGSLFLTVTWILYYELDAFVIAKLLGPDSVAIYAIGFTILTFVRGLFGLLFSPFFARFNHLIGLNDVEGLRRLYVRIVALTLPFVVFPILSLALLMKPFVSTWVGSHYENSVFIAQLLILCFIYGFISYPGGFLVIAQERIKVLYLTAATALIIYWTGIALTIHFMGLTSFALFKLIAMSCSGVMYFFITINFLGFTPGEFVKKILGPVAIPLGFLILSLSCLRQFMPAEKNALNFFIVVATGGLVSAAALALYYLLSNHFRNYAQSILRECFATNVGKIYGCL
jgi:O-antigen/teichoic acid export membrane protein